jgi:glycerophosphoryl diester phosphodiesterase
MKIIGHRGAAGIAPENSLTAIRAARISGVDAIEIDVQTTKDDRLVVFHDKTLRRLASRPENVFDLTSDELSKVKLKNGAHIPTMEEAFEAAQDTPLYIEGKGTGWAELLDKSLEKYRYTKTLTVISFNKSELVKFAKLRPDIKLYIIKFFNGPGAVSVARRNGFSGITINLLAINPAVYAAARKNKLDINIFTNSKLLKHFIKILVKLYPRIQITTNYPDLLIEKNEK